MQIVVTLSEEDYNLLVNVNDDKLPSMNARRHLREQLKIGISLPKGHGRLIDADAINIHDVSPAYGMEVYGVTQDDLEYEPTIIEADKDGE